MKTKDLLFKIKRKLTAAYITKVALLSAISFILYLYGKFALPFMFPSFLDMQFSELPALLAGFALDPVAGAIVIVVKCLLKFPFSGTAFVGELTDMLLGILYVVPAAIIYHRNKTKKTALIGLISGTLIATAAAVLVNRFISIPFYVSFYFKGNFDIIVGMLKPLYKTITRRSFYFYYLLVAVVPFNLLRLGVVSFVTFLVYKVLSKPLHWEWKAKKKAEEEVPENVPAGVTDETIALSAETKANAEENAESSPATNE